MTEKDERKGGRGRRRGFGFCVVGGCPVFFGGEGLKKNGPCVMKGGVRKRGFGRGQKA